MSIQVGSSVHAERTGAALRVAKKLGEGGQGTVFLVESGQERYALKWYNAEQATAEQRQAIHTLAASGPPPGPAGRRFVWPLDIVTAPGSRQFGYLMPLIDMTRFAELGDIWARLKPVPGFRQLTSISYQAANSYRALHLGGYCYRDISAGNLVFDPVAGDVMICDNDNVGINRQSTCQVWGTMEYMAPELVRGEAQPSTETDLHSLAVLLFQLWVWHHPMHGELEYKIRSWDLVGKRHIYGGTPVFIFDPKDERNRLPEDPDYETAARRWQLCPPSLRQLFTRAFTVGLRDPSNRVTEGEWQKLFLQLCDCAIDCPACRATNLCEPGTAGPSCWHCRVPIKIPPRLVFDHVNGSHVVLLPGGTRILRRHAEPLCDDEHGGAILGEVVPNPANPGVWGIRNLTSAPWTAQHPDGRTQEVPPQRAVPLNAGLKLHIAGAVATIVS